MNLIILVAVAAIAALVVTSMPDISRYFQLREM
ncbi:MAG: DUF6893 family small protein [Acidimicrobiales bacterium]